MSLLTMNSKCMKSFNSSQLNGYICISQKLDEGGDGDPNRIMVLRSLDKLAMLSDDELRLTIGSQLSNRISRFDSKGRVLIGRKADASMAALNTPFFTLAY